MSLGVINGLQFFIIIYESCRLFGQRNRRIEKYNTFRQTKIFLDNKNTDH